MSMTIFSGVEDLARAREERPAWALFAEQNDETRRAENLSPVFTALLRGFALLVVGGGFFLIYILAAFRA